jgi:hypothetical protein
MIDPRGLAYDPPTTLLASCHIAFVTRRTQSHTITSAIVFCDEDNPKLLQRQLKLQQGASGSANSFVGTFDALDSRQPYFRAFSQLSLAKAKERPRSADLCWPDHDRSQEFRPAVKKQLQQHPY